MLKILGVLIGLPIYYYFMRRSDDREDDQDHAQSSVYWVIVCLAAFYVVIYAFAYLSPLSADDRKHFLGITRSSQ